MLNLTFFLTSDVVAGSMGVPGGVGGREEVLDVVAGSMGVPCGVVVHEEVLFQKRLPK
jgi:hypothetical protein